MPTEVAVPEQAIMSMADIVPRRAGEEVVGLVGCCAQNTVPSARGIRPGLALAARYRACCKARTGSAGIPRPDPFAAD